MTRRRPETGARRWGRADGTGISEGDTARTAKCRRGSHSKDQRDCVGTQGQNRPRTASAAHGLRASHTTTLVGHAVAYHMKKKPPKLGNAIKNRAKDIRLAGIDETHLVISEIEMLLQKKDLGEKDRIILGADYKADATDYAFVARILPPFITPKKTNFGRWQTFVFFKPLARKSFPSFIHNAEKTNECQPNMHMKIPSVQDTSGLIRVPRINALYRSKNRLACSCPGIRSYKRWWIWVFTIESISIRDAGTEEERVGQYLGRLQLDKTLTGS